MKAPAPLKKIRTLSFLNLSGYILVIVMNFLANALPVNGQNTGEISAKYPNLFTPAGFTFGIWGLIYILLLLFIIYQFYVAYNPEKNQNFILRIGYWFLLSCLGNASWILAWHHEKLFLSVLIMVVIFLSLAAIYFGMDIGRQPATNREKYLVHMPFSVYFSWINVAIIANIAVLLTDTGWGGFGLSPQFWTILMILIVIFLALLVLFSRKDIYYVAVIIWALSGILYKRMYDSVAADWGIEITIVGGLIILVSAGLIQLFRKKVY